MTVLTRFCLVVFTLFIAAAIGVGLVPTSDDVTGYDCGAWLNPEFSGEARTNIEGYRAELEEYVDSFGIGTDEPVLADDKARLVRGMSECDDILRGRNLTSIGLLIAAAVVPALIWFVSRGRRSTTA